MSRISNFRSFVSMENGCAGAGKNFVFRTCGGPTQWCMMRVSLESVEVRWGALRIDVAGVWNDGFLWIFDVWDDVSMMIHWIGVQMELLKSHVFDFNLPILEATRKTWRFFVFSKITSSSRLTGITKVWHVCRHFFPCNGKLRREILKKRSTHLPSTLAVRLQNSYKVKCGTIIWDTTVTTAFPLSIHSWNSLSWKLNTQNISDCYVENKNYIFTKLQFFNMQNILRFVPTLSWPQPFILHLINHSTSSPVCCQGWWKQILHFVSPGDFSQRASAEKCFYFFVRGGEVKRAWARGLSLCFFLNAAPNCINYILNYDIWFIWCLKLC